VSLRAQEKAAVGLAMVAGYVDAYSFLTYRIYVSFLSGNTTQTGSLIGQGNAAGAAPAVLAIVFFLIGVFAGAFLARSDARQLRRPLGFVAALLAVSIGVSRSGFLGGGAVIATLGLAMGFMNTALSRVGGQPVNLVFVTGTLSAMAQHLALAVKRAPVSEAQGTWDTHKRRAFLLMGVWIAFMSGAVLAGIGTSRFGVSVLLLPILLLLWLAALDR
jgi:uncharacterized membrane protein YoaK (UPF0700 family)